MRPVINQIIDFLQQGIAAIFRFFDLVWTWSFGEMVKIFNSDWQNLPPVKLIILAMVVIAIVYVLYRALFELWGAAESILKAFVQLLMVLVSILPYILVAGAIAAGGSYIIQHVTI